MPLYDNIADAFELLHGGSPVALTNVGATEETNENANAAGNAGVWMRVDLSEYLTGATVDVDISVSGVTGTGFHPYIDVMRVVDPTFDPASPDFSKLSFLSGGFPYLGDGTAAPSPVTMPLVGGAFGASPSGNRSATGIYYLYFTDYDYDGSEGSATVSYAVPVPPICFDATDIINPDSATASVVSGRVLEEWDKYWDYGANPYNKKDQTLKLTWTGDPGLYKMYVSGQMTADHGGGAVTAIVSVNGRPFIGTTPSQPNAGTTPFTITPYNGLDAETADVYDDSDYRQNPWLVLNTGDVVEIMLVSWVDLPSFTGFCAFECSQVCFELDPAAPSSVYCTGGIAFEDRPLGDEWGSPNSWGGQRFVPSQIIAEEGITPYDESNFPWGVNQTNYDFVALDDGTVYVFFMDSDQFTGDPTTQPSVPSSQRWFLVVHKYDPGSDSWSQIATLNVNNPSLHYMLDGTTCELGPDGFVYACWWELDSWTYGSPTTYLWKWHVIKLDPSDDSYVELGSGQHALPAGTNTHTNYDMTGSAGDGLANQLVIMENGDVYVTSIELADITTSYRRRPYVWRWNGSSWTNLNIPDPSLIGPSATYHVLGENQFWDQLVLACPADESGPINGITVVYSYVYTDGVNDLRPLYTNTYVVGTGWVGEVLTSIETVETGRMNGASGVAYGVTMADGTLLWSEKLGKLVLASDFILSGDEIWDMIALKADRSDWELLEDIAPASSAGPWRQMRNQAAIGPDGDIYRVMMSDSIDTNFEPHVIKHSPGYAFGFANAARKAIGDIDYTDAQGQVWEGATIFFEATTHFRIRWAGNSCYVMGAFFVEAMNGETMPDWPNADGVFIVKGSYVPCAGPISLARIKFRSFSQGDDLG